MDRKVKGRGEAVRWPHSLSTVEGAVMGASGAVATVGVKRPDHKHGLHRRP